MYSSERNVDSIVQQGYTVKIGDYIQRGWGVMQQNLGGFIGFTVVIVLISLIPAALGQRLGPLASLAVNVISPILLAGYLIVAFKILKRQSTTFNDFFQGFSNFLPIFLTSLLVSIFTFLGFLVLILPGVFLAVAYAFSIPFVVGRKFDFWEAMEASRKVVTKNWFPMFLFLLAIVVLNVVGALLLGVGLLFTIPLSYCAIAVAFEDIVGLPISDSSIA
ncbi:MULTISPECIES: hypothetical protein [unclassified Leptolyngbya]|uniref:hypothetical protein n=1 Tax=unclassified Leptolyngbya TaxID=2650499 RepID=UPI00168472B2|nr:MULTISPECIES: hypothetical protein [unclassified Leptolyngbya]MBD1910102.1 hypothetical protein [Leptolyngbya sp. FACHB-8]MBD2156874.1 hypothetical protein [Leptolyngbya sp. FACHB-16]